MERLPNDCLIHRKGLRKKRMIWDWHVLDSNAKAVERILTQDHKITECETLEFALFKLVGYLMLSHTTTSGKMLGQWAISIWEITPDSFPVPAGNCLKEAAVFGGVGFFGRGAPLHMSSSGTQWSHVV